jgi:hypothetical protein
MQGLLALAWLSPKDPNVIDNWFGKYADLKQTYANQLDLALLMLVVFLVFLLWRTVRHNQVLPRLVRPRDAEHYDWWANRLKDERVKTWAERVVTAVLVFVALLASVNYFYGTRNNGTYVHRWDAFHTVIGVKYHHELGYFDLYKCAYAIDREGPHHFRAVKDIRDLRTRKFVPREQHIAGNKCKERFTPERLAEFKHDLDEFGTWSSKSQWRILFKDKGFNGTPFYATVCKLLIGTIDVDLDGLKRLAKIDPILMFIAFGVVGWAFGARKAAITAIFFCAFFPNRFVHMGGSILRFDYVATLMIGFAALKKDKWGLAGVMFAWATMVRVFPAIFAVGVGLKMFVDIVEHKKIREEHWRFIGFALGGLALFFVISLVGMDGGFENWRTWFENMQIHNSKSASFRIGFKHLFMADGKLTGNDFGLKQRNFEARKLWYDVAVVVMLAPLLFSVRRLDTVSFGVMFGVFGFFLLAIATRYYYGVVALLFLIDREPLKNRYMLIMGALLFTFTAIDFAYFELNDSDSFMYNIVIGVEMAALIVVMGSWLLFNPTLLDLDDDPRLPAMIPAARGATVAAVEPAKVEAVTPDASEPPANPAEIETISDGPLGDPAQVGNAKDGDRKAP